MEAYKHFSHLSVAKTTQHSGLFPAALGEKGREECSGMLQV